MALGRLHRFKYLVTVCRKALVDHPLTIRIVISLLL